jgi:hypothetical protein
LERYGTTGVFWLRISMWQSLAMVFMGIDAAAHHYFDKCNLNRDESALLISMLTKPKIL